MDKITLDIEKAVAIYEYLQTRPYKEVAGAVEWLILEINKAKKKVDKK